MPTVSGLFLIAIALGIGTAAYNTGNNILFITLSLLLACLILSGILSRLNFARVNWRIQVEGRLRAGQPAALRLELQNRKRLLPAYALSFWVRAEEEGTKSSQLHLEGRLEARGGTAEIPWSWTPRARGRVALLVDAVSSLFPFGFLKKTYPGDGRREVLVWPQSIDYRRFSVPAPQRRPMGEQVGRVGQNGDLMAVRAYQHGDSHRLIHWKASARTGQLLVRQHAAETRSTTLLWVETSTDRWPRPEQFEVMIRLAATLAEDLFREGRLAGYAIDDEPAKVVRKVQDVEQFLDELAVRQISPQPLRDSKRPRLGRESPGVLRFFPDGNRAVTADVNGDQAATA